MSRRAAPVAAAFLAAAALALGGCSRSAREAPPPELPEPPALDSGGSPVAAPETAVPVPGRPEGAVAVLSFHLGGFSAQTPPDAAHALAWAVRGANPDVLVLQGVGPDDALDRFQALLAEAGLPPYPHAFLFQLGRNPSNLAILSRVPIAENLSHPDDSFSVGPERFTVQHGFLDVVLAPPSAPPFRILAADLKSKEFHAYGQTEMRRNEARLLANHVRAALRDDPGARLLVCGAFNDTPDSAPLRALLDPALGLADIRPLDPHGRAWTSVLPDDTCERADYLLASPALLAAVVPNSPAIHDFSPSLVPFIPRRPLFLLLAPPSPSP